MESTILMEATGEPRLQRAACLQAVSDRLLQTAPPSIRIASDDEACCSLWCELTRLPIHDEFSLVLSGRPSR
jgi:hypothetical protein